jgi:hypothetical protein
MQLPKMLYLVSSRYQASDVNKQTVDRDTGRHEVVVGMTEDF